MTNKHLTVVLALRTLTIEFVGGLQRNVCCTAWLTCAACGCSVKPGAPQAGKAGGLARCWHVAVVASSWYPGAHCEQSPSGAVHAAQPAGQAAQAVASPGAA